MVSKIDQYEQKVSSIQASLDALKNEALSAVEKQQRTAEIKREAEAEKLSVEQRMNELKDKTDAESMSEMEKAQNQLDTLNEIINVQLSVLTSKVEGVSSSITPTVASEIQSTSNKIINNPNEKKGFFGKTKDWIGDQWSDIWNKEKWETEGGVNLLRTAGFVATGVGAISLAVKGIKKLFGKDKKKEEDSETKEEKETKEKKSFREKPFGKFVKWTGIGTGIYYIWHGAYTGKWGLRDFFDLSKDKRTESTESQMDDYDNLSPEQKESYSNLGNTVDSFYGNLWNKEKSLGYEDSNALCTIVKNVQLKDGKTMEDYTYTGLVPFCIDSGVDNIKELLSEKDLNECAFNKDYNDLKNKVKGWTLEKLEKILGPFVSKLASFVNFGKESGSLGEKIKKWLDYDEDSRENELNMFFRQYTKVLSFVKDKEKSLQYKLAEEEIRLHGYNGESLPQDPEDKLDLLEEAIDDEERFKLKIENKEEYKKFMDSKLSGCRDVLKSQGLMNEYMSPVLQGKISKLDKETDSLLQIEDGKSVLDRGLAEISGGLTEGTKKDLIEMCDDVKDDIVDETGTGFMQEYLEWISYSFNMDESNKEAFLQESGLKYISEGYISTLEEYREKFKRGEATTQDLEKLKEITLAYMAFKKEMNIAVHTMSSIRSDNPDGTGRMVNGTLKILSGLRESFTNIIGGKGKFGDWVSLGVTVSVVGGTVYIIKHPGKVVIGAVNGAINGIGWIAGRPGLSAYGLKKYIKNLKPQAAQKSYFLHYVLNGKITNENRLLKIARDVFNMDEKSLEMVLVNMKIGITEDEAKILLKHVDDKKIRKLCITESVSDNANIADRFLRKKTARKFEVTAKNKKILEDIGKIDEKIKSLNKGAKNTIISMLRKAKDAESVENIRFFVEDPKVMEEIEKLSKSECKQLKNCSIEELKNIHNKIKSGEIKSIKEGLGSKIPGTEALSDSRKAFNETIDKAISKFKELPDGDLFRDIHLSNLEKVKAEKFLDEEMDAFVKFTKNGFPVEDLPDLIKLFKIETKFGSKQVPLGQHLEDLLKSGRYGEFKGLLNDPKLGKMLKTVNKPKLVKNFRALEKNLFKGATRNMDDLMKLTMKIISKML